MKTVHSIQNNMKEFDAFARTTVDSRTPEHELQQKWKDLFHTNLSIQSAKSFAKYYRKMRIDNTRQKGGSYSLASAAQLDYKMIPGLNTESYGRFPVAVNTDTQSIHDLDIYFQNSLTKNCGVENSSLTLPEGMGYNAVGGSKKDRKNNSSSRKNRVSRKNNRKDTERREKSQRAKSTRRNRSTRKNNGRKQRGGVANLMNFGPSMYWRPYTASQPDNILQKMGETAFGSTYVSPSSSPSQPSWGYLSTGTKGTLNPGNITRINENGATLASPTPYQGSSATGVGAVSAMQAALGSAGMSAQGQTRL